MQFQWKKLSAYVKGAALYFSHLKFTEGRTERGITARSALN